MAGDYEILGIDYHQDKLYLVQIDRVHDKTVWTNSACVRFTRGASVVQIAEKLRQTLDDFGFSAGKAVFSLAPDSGFVQFSDKFESHRELHPEGVVEDTWITPGGTSVVGLAPHGDVMRAAQIASHANLEILGVELRSLATMCGTGLVNRKPQDRSNLVLVVDREVITLGLFKAGELENIQTHNRDKSSSCEDDLKTVRRMIRLMELSGFQVGTAQAMVQAVVYDPNLQDILKQKLGVEVQPCSPQQLSSLEVSRDNPETGVEYTAALGLAIEGIRKVTKAEPQYGFNFLTACFDLRESGKINIRKMAVGAVVLIAILLLVTIGSVISKQFHRARLQERYRDLEPRRMAYIQATELQKSIRNWLPLGSGGQRTAYRPIFDAITELFPSTEQGYVTNLEIKYDPEGRVVVIRMDGRSRSSEVLFEFISRLNNSMIFDKATLGKVTDIADATSPYIKKFSLTFAIRQKNDV